MLQLCYASTFVNHNDDLIEDIRSILTTARVFNKQHEITGVLYYAQGKFFQCLEGEPEQVENLFQQILKDKRHTNIYRFPDNCIEKSNFKDWSMKYVQKNSEIKEYFLSIGCTEFQPHILDKDQLKEVLNILYSVNESKTPLPNQGYLQRGYTPYL